MSGSLPNLGYCAPRMMASSLTAPRASDEVGRVRPLDAVQLVHAGLDLVQRVVVHLRARGAGKSPIRQPGRAAKRRKTRKGTARNSDGNAAHQGACTLWCVQTSGG